MGISIYICIYVNIEGIGNHIFHFSLENESFSVIDCDGTKYEGYFPILYLAHSPLV